MGSLVIRLEKGSAGVQREADINRQQSGLGEVVRWLGGFWSFVGLSYGQDR